MVKNAYSICLNNSSMVVEGHGGSIIVILLEGDNTYLKKGDQNAEDEPDINHSDIRCWRKLFHNTDENGSQYQHGCYVDRQSCLKKE